MRYYKNIQKLLFILVGIFCLNLSVANVLFTVAYKNKSFSEAQLKANPSNNDLINLLSSLTNTKMRYVSSIMKRTYTLMIESKVSDNDVEQILQKIKSSDPDILYVEKEIVLKLDDPDINENNSIFVNNNQIIPLYHYVTPYVELNQQIFSLKSNFYSDLNNIASNRSNINNLQWHMTESFSINMNNINNVIYGDAFLEAFNVLNQTLPNTRPGESIIIAVIDTGYTPHANIESNLLKEPDIIEYGYQFISDCRSAGICPMSTPNDKANLYPRPGALDMGDYITQEQINEVKGSNIISSATCKAESQSSWHGTHIIGNIIAQGYDVNKSNGILGAAYGALVVPIRAVGKCGGLSSDVAGAILWAANLYPRIINHNPAQIINLSLSLEAANSQCPAILQQAINKVVANGVIVIAAAGNQANNFANYTPANCNGVISVSSKGPLNKLSSFSNYGNTTSTASGGENYVSEAGISAKIYSTLWASEQQVWECLENGVPCESWGYQSGTSQATSHVSATVAMMLSYLKIINKPYTWIGISKILQDTSMPFDPCIEDSSSKCVTSGTLNAKAAIAKLIEDPALANIPVSLPPTSIASRQVGCTMTLYGSDISIIITLLLIIIVYFYLRYRTKEDHKD